MASSYRLWSRYCVMDDFDDGMFSYALKDAFPNILFLNNINLLREPALTSADTIPECDRSLVYIWFPQDGWQPLFFPHPDYPDRFNIINPPALYLYYNRTSWFFGGPEGERRWAFSLPMPERGRIYSGRWGWDEDEKAFRKKIVNILGKLSSNRLKDWFQRDEFVSTKDAKRRNIWAGRHVQAWCSQDPRRALDSMFRVPDDWRFEENDWYRKLKQRVIDRFGPDFGRPNDAD